MSNKNHSDNLSFLKAKQISSRDESELEENLIEKKKSNARNYATNDPHQNKDDTFNRS